MNYYHSLRVTGECLVIQLLVLRNRRQWLLTAILRSGYVKILIL